MHAANFIYRWQHAFVLFCHFVSFRFDVFGLSIRCTGMQLKLWAVRMWISLTPLLRVCYYLNVWIVKWNVFDSQSDFWFDCLFLLLRFLLQWICTGYQMYFDVFIVWMLFDNIFVFLRSKHGRNVIFLFCNFSQKRKMFNYRLAINSHVRLIYGCLNDRWHHICDFK